MVPTMMLLKHQDYQFVPDAISLSFRNILLPYTNLLCTLQDDSDEYDEDDALDALSPPLPPPYTEVREYAFH